MWPDKEFEQPFTVIRPLDVNADPALQVVHVSRFYPIFFLFLANWITYFEFHRFQLQSEKVTHFSWVVYYAVVYRNQSKLSFMRRLVAIHPVK